MNKTRKTTKTKKNNNEKKPTSNPDGYDITIYPEYYTTVAILIITVIVYCLLVKLFKPFFQSMNEWVAVALSILFISIIVLLLMDCALRLVGATINIRLTDVGLEQRKVKGPSWIPDIQIVKWEEMDYYYLFGRRHLGSNFNGDDFFIDTKRGKDYAFSTMAFFRRERELKKTMKAFRSEFLRLANHKGIKRQLLWEEKQESFDKKHLEW